MFWPRTFGRSCEFERIVQLGRRSGLNGRTSPTSSISRIGLGIAAAGEGRDRAGPLCDGPVRRVVIPRVFVKKTQKTPRREIELARQRAKEVT